MELVLGVDGGGTHTRARIANTRGEILGNGEAGTSNLHAAGLASAQVQVLNAVRFAFDQAGLGMQKVSAVCLGLGGTDRPEERLAWTAWAEEHLADRAIVVNDGEIVLAAGTPENWGLALIAGTGSIAWGKTREGKMARAGGWGYLIGDEGSSYDLARQALSAAAQAADGRGPDTQLLAAILEHWGCREPRELIPRAYRPGTKPADIAALAPVITRCAERGDPVARRLVVDAAQSLATTVRAVCVALDFPGTIPLAITGGLLLSSAVIRKELLGALARLPYRIEPVSEVHEPVQGAVRLARELLLHAHSEP